MLKGSSGLSVAFDSPPALASLRLACEQPRAGAKNKSVVQPSNRSAATRTSGPRQKNRDGRARSVSQPGAAGLREIFAQTRTPAFRAYVRRLLLALCSINTTPNADVNTMRKAEDGCFRILEAELGALSHANARLERRPINPAIQNHANFSLLHFTKTTTLPQGLSPEQVYAGRSNLLYFIPGTSGQPRGSSIALNAHLDVVAPYFPPRARGQRIYGRGSCDDKGPVVGLVAALKVLSRVMGKKGLAWNRNVLAMFVVEEETGGNGSLSLAIDPQLRSLYDSVLVSECTGLKLHPANRGAVWYRASLEVPPGVSAFELFAFINEEMEKEGAAIRTESSHALFPQRPVQTCHGILGSYGEHPSRICGQVSFQISCERRLTQAVMELVCDCLNAGLAGYVGLYGDKSKVIDPATSKPMVPRHYQIRRESNRLRIEVYGAAGHMGSIRERDGAITKTAHLVRSLVYSKARLEKMAGPVKLDLVWPRKQTPHPLILEGGQGFVPTHRITEVMQRLSQAAERGAENYLRRLGQNEFGARVVRVTYEKLHNVAFDGDPASPTMQQALAAARACGIPQPDPVLGWTVSCDARLFATEYPGLPVLTFGPGQLVHAHSDHEQIDLDEIRAAAEFTAFFLLLQTGTLPTR